MAKRRGAYHHSITNPQKVTRRNNYKNYGFGLHLSNIRRSPSSTNKTCEAVNIRRPPGSTNKTCATLLSTQTVRGTLHSTDSPCSTADNAGIDPGPTNETNGVLKSTETVRGRLHYTDHLCRATDNNCSPPCSTNKSSGTLESNKTVREKLHSTDNIFRTTRSTNQTTGPNMVRATGMIEKSSYTTSNINDNLLAADNDQNINRMKNGIFERKKDEDMIPIEVADNDQNIPQMKNGMVERKNDEDMIPIEVNKALKQKRLFLNRFDYLRNFYIRRMIMKPGVRVDNVVMKQLKKEGMVLDKRKIIGPIPGIEVGECFNLRRKLMIMSIHTQLIHGIDCTTTARGRLIATSIVTSEGYGDIFLNSGELIYNGEGSTFERKTRYADDQKLERGNLALKNCMETGSYVRVIRGLKIKGKEYAKKYVYDGLYRVVRCYKKQAKHGAMQWKFKLIRNSGQKTIDWKSFYYIYAS